MTGITLTLTVDTSRLENALQAFPLAAVPQAFSRKAWANANWIWGVARRSSAEHYYVIKYNLRHPTRKVSLCRLNRRQWDERNRQTEMRRQGINRKRPFPKSFNLLLDKVVIHGTMLERLGESLEVDPTCVSAVYSQAV